MFVSMNWLNQYVDVADLNPAELAERITRTGIEVESVQLLSEATNCVIGHVLERVQHPNADKLSVLQVDLGQEDGVVQIVCGAKNVAAGQKVIIAKVGAVLPGDFKIKKSKLRGEASNGMCCSLKELGIEQKLVPTAYAEGIFVCAEDAPVGVDAIEYLQFNDTVIELGLTPNRMDCLSMYGVAYEVAAILQRPVKFNEISVEEGTDAAADYINISTQTEKSPQYLGRVIKNVEIKESPQWLQATLIAAGMRPKNNVVDITNYVMLELGQPLHAFDYNTIASKQIVVREANDGEEMITLDGQTRSLVAGDIVITNGQAPIALAGVMGGENTEVTDETTTVFLESAMFDRLQVRKTATRLGLRSESSARFEKGIDPKRVRMALDRAAALLVELANGEVCQGVVSYDNFEAAEKTISITVEKINSVLGTTMSVDEVSAIWTRLQFGYELDGSTFNVFVPSRRLDITIVEDLIEEAGRIYGYDNIPMTLPRTNSKGGYSPAQMTRNVAHKALQGCGLSEVITYSLTSEVKYKQFKSQPAKCADVVKLAMPMSEDRAYLRQGMIPQLLEVVRYNNARTMADVAIYEIGKVYGQAEGSYIEETKMAGAVTGSIRYNKWQAKVEAVDFFVAKGYVETLLMELGYANVSYVPVAADEYKEFHPGRSAVVLVNGEAVGVVGQVHPELQRQLDLNETYVFELSFDDLLAQDTHKSAYETIAKFPGMTRDIAVVVDCEVLAGELVATIKNAANKLLQTVEVFDIYEGKGVEVGKKSVAISLYYLNRENTLTDEELQPVHQKVLNALTSEHNASLRS
ncbi:MAG TPA: phenylalanine--tRNA ligase subunit beta [Firmicutes bacterium]|nr:phenylalanine--tRNA ligase subunit beta [Bacillota bacterium]